MRGKTVLQTLGVLILMLLLVACGRQSGQQGQEGTTGDSLSTSYSQNDNTAANGGTTGNGSATTDDRKDEVADNDDKKDVDNSRGNDKANRDDNKNKNNNNDRNKVTVVTLPESTVIAIELIDSIDTDIHVTGTEFRVRILQPVVYNGMTVFEEGAEGVGVMNKVVESGRMKTPAELTISLAGIQDASGKLVNLDTYSITEKKDSHTKRQVGMIGGGALVGGIIGKITGKKGGTEAGLAAGAAAGAAAAAATGKQDIVLHSGTQVNFVLRSPVSISVPSGREVSSR